MNKQFLTFLAILILGLTSKAVSLPSNNLKDYYLVYTSDVILEEIFDNLSWGQEAPSGWTIIEAKSGYFNRGNVGVVQGDWSNSNNFGGSGYSFEIGSGTANSGTNMAITPVLETLGGGSIIEFYAKKSEGNPSLIVGLLTDPSDESTFEAIKTINLNENYSRFKIEVSSRIEGKYVGIKLNYSGTYQTAYFDNISITTKTLSVKRYKLNS